jgi:hypothetical protein
MAPPVGVLDPHLSDGALLALHDGERGPEADIGRAHVERCDECRARLNGVGANARHVRRSLSSIRIPSVSEEAFRRRVEEAGARRAVPIARRPAWLAAAAVIVLVGVAAASPVRNWLRRQFEHSSVQVRPFPAPVPNTSDTRSVDHAGATVSFASTGPEFTLRFDSLPAAGALTAERADGPEISARVVSGAGTGGDAMVVLPAELRVRNSTSARTSYTVTLPNAVTRLRVIVAGRSIFDGVPPAVIQLHPR